MKNIYIGIFACSMLFAGCQTELYNDPIEDFQSDQGVYMLSSESSQIFVQENKDVNVTNIIIGLAQKSENEQSVELELGNQAQLDAYNKKHNTEFIMLPKEMYSLASDVKFEREQTSMIVPLQLKDIKFSMEGTYALPVRIKGANVAVIPGQTETLLILEQRINTKCVLMHGSGSEDAEMFPNDFKVKQWTMEAMVNRKAYERNNRAICGTKLVQGAGPNDEIYPRFGDVTIKTNQLQIKTGASQIDVPSSKFSAKPDEWYMISFVYDGNKHYVYVNGNLVADREIRSGAYGLVGFWIGGANDYIREVRFWKTARTPQQVKDYVWKMVDARDENLLLYYPLNGKKFNQATGEITEDETMFWDWSKSEKHLKVANGAVFDDNGGKGFTFPLEE